MYITILTIVKVVMIYFTWNFAVSDVIGMNDITIIQSFLLLVFVNTLKMNNKSLIKDFEEAQRSLESSNKDK